MTNSVAETLFTRVNAGLLDYLVPSPRYSGERVRVRGIQSTLDHQPPAPGSSCFFTLDLIGRLAGCLKKREH
jgi:hypothetical protein